MNDKVIQIDCAPGPIRPGDLIGKVIENTGLELKEANSTFFGNWTWDYNDVDDATWEKAKPIVGARIKGLYEQGVIRFGSW